MQMYENFNAPVFNESKNFYRPPETGNILMKMFIASLV